MKKWLILILSILLFMNSVLAIEIEEDEISKKIIFSVEEIVLSDTKFKHSSFFNLKILNNDNVKYKIKYLSQSGSLKDSLKVKDLYKYYLKENNTEGRFPYTFEPYLCIVLSSLSPVSAIMFLAALDSDFKKNVEIFVVNPVKSIILIPTNIFYKVEEGKRNKKIKAELLKYFDIKDVIEYDKFKDIIIEPKMEIQIPIVENDYFIILQNIETNEEYRFDENGLRI